MSGSAGNLITSGSTIGCPHGGRARPASGAASAPAGVRLDGLPVHTDADVFAISGCPHVLGGVPHPCTSIRWTGDTDGVLVDGAPVLLHTTHAQCLSAGLVPQGPPVVSAVQREVVSR